MKYDTDEFRIRKYKSATEWKFDSLVKEKMSSQGFEKTNFQHLRLDSGVIYDESNTLFDAFLDYKSSEDESSRLYKYLVVEQLFTKEKGDVLSRAEDFSKYNRKVALRNRQSWSHANDVILNRMLDRTFKVRSTEELMYEKKLSSYPVLGSLNTTRV